MNQKPENIVTLRYNYEQSINDCLLVEYKKDNGQIDITDKKVVIFVQYYDEKHKNYQFFGTQFIDPKQIPPLEWLVINDCNITSSTIILGCENNFQNLIGLDLSFNSINDFGSIGNLVKNSPNLQYLDLSHNPIEFQPELQEIILKENPKITSINRKRVTPADFYNLYQKDNKQTEDFLQCQIFSAIRTVEKDRIYPLEAEKTERSSIDHYNLKPNLIDTHLIQAIDLSNCYLIYFNFSLFPNAFFIDISNNKIEKVDFKKDQISQKNETNKKLLYLDISNNFYKEYNILESVFPNCKINPHHLNKKHHLKEEVRQSSDSPSPSNNNIDNYTFESLFHDIIVSFGSLSDHQEVISVKIKAEERTKNFVNFVNTNKSNNKYTVSSKSIKKSLKCANNNLIVSNDVRIEILNNDVPINSIFNTMDELYLPLYFIAYLNLENIKINDKDFNLICSKCVHLQQLIVKFQNIEEGTVTDKYFNKRSFHNNKLEKLTDLDIYFDNYSFESKKQYNKFIKQICHIPQLQNFNIFNYSTAYSQNDEVDTTFKFLRGLDTFNGYRNLIPPTPAQYYASTSFLPNYNDDDDNNDNNDANNKILEYQNFNNLQFLYLRKNDLPDSSSNKIKYSKILPIRQIKIENVNETPTDVQDIVNQYSDSIFDKYPRLKDVNGMKVKKELKPQSEKDSQNENETFKSWTSKVDKLLESISQIQFFILYSIKSSSSFVSKFLFFIYSTLISIERFLIQNNITLSTDFTSSCERLIVLSIAPILALKLLYWEPSYGSFVNIASKNSSSIRNLILIALFVTLSLIFLAVIDSIYFELEAVYFPYIVQFLLFIIFWCFAVAYYFKNISIRHRRSNDEDDRLQESRSFVSYQEFKFFKSKVAYSCLTILVIPMLSIIFNSDLSFTFVDTYKVLFTIVILSIITILLYSKTNEQCNKIIDYLGLDVQNKEIQNQNQDPNKTHYFVIKPDDNKNIFSKIFNTKIFDGAFQYTLTPEDKLYQKFAAELRTPTQIFYSSYRYRGLQRFYGLIEITQRIFTEIISKYMIRWLFIVPLFFFFYVLIWWPHYDNIDNISILLSSFGKVLMSLFNFLFYYFGYDDNKIVQSVLTYMNIFGILCNVVGIILGFHTLIDLVKLEKDETSKYRHEFNERIDYNPLLEAHDF